MDRSLNPLSSHALLRFFVESSPGAWQQMIVTTHETHLLDLDLLRRDEIWFVIGSEDRYAVKQYLNLFKSTKIQFRVLETEHGHSSPSQVMSRLDAFMKDHDFGEGDQFWLVADTDHWIESSHIQNLVEVARPSARTTKPKFSICRSPTATWPTQSGDRKQTSTRQLQFPPSCKRQCIK